MVSLYAQLKPRGENYEPNDLENNILYHFNRFYDTDHTSDRIYIQNIYVSSAGQCQHHRRSGSADV